MQFGNQQALLLTYGFMILEIYRPSLCICFLRVDRISIALPR